MRSLCVLVLGLTACNMLPTSLSKLKTGDATEVGADISCDGAIEEVALPVSFAAHSANCTFDDGTNGSPVAGFWQAYKSQKVVVELPPYKKLCNAKISSVSSKMLYADALVLLWERYVLLSSEKLATGSLLESELGTGLVWDWERIRGVALRFVDEPFCIDAGGMCLIPKAGAYDSMTVTLNPVSLKAILEKQAGKARTNFTLITAGDGAEWEPLQDTSLTDCYNRALDLELKITYVPSDMEPAPDNEAPPAEPPTVDTVDPTPSDEP